MILNPQVLEQLFGTAKLVIIQNKIETFHVIYFYYFYDYILNRRLKLKELN